MEKPLLHTWSLAVEEQFYLVWPVLVLLVLRRWSVRALAVASLQRSALLPDTPTVLESGIADFVTDSWYGLLGPAGTPKPIIDRIAAEVTAIFADKALREKLAVQDMVAVDGSDPASFTARIAQETRMWREVVAKQGLKLE